MKLKRLVGFVAFGEVNTPLEKLREKHDQALAALADPDYEILDGGLVIDDPDYGTADAAVCRLQSGAFDALVLCICGWVPTHAVVRVADTFRHLPMMLWGLCGWKERGKLVTTAEQAGTTALRATLQELGYRFKFVYNTIGAPMPAASIRSFLTAASAASRLRRMRIGTMGYRDMLLYGTQFEGFSMRREIGLEVEPYEMLEMVQTLDQVDEDEVQRELEYIQSHWKMDAPCPEGILEKGVRYALAIGKKIEACGWDAVTLIDVDGMKKLLGFPPAMVFMILTRRYGVPTIPENDVMGNATQLIAGLLTGEIPCYMEYYEFFSDSVLIGVPDYVPEHVIAGEVHMLPTAFGQLSASLLNVSKVRTGPVTCVRLIYTGGKYALHLYTGMAKTPQPWEEYGWAPPAPQLPSLEVVLDSPVEEFAQNVASQHVIVTYGDNREVFEDFAKLLGLAVI